MYNPIMNPEEVCFLVTRVMYENVTYGPSQERDEKYIVDVYEVSSQWGALPLGSVCPC